MRIISDCLIANNAHFVIDTMITYLYIIDKLDWFVCLTVSMKTITKAACLKKTFPIQCTSDIVATLGHHFMATISDWSLYPT